MREGSPSATAELVCSWRALEHTLPPGQRILDDPYARGFLGPIRGGLVDGASVLPVPARRLILRRIDQVLQGAVTFVLARHRAIDDLILTTPSDQVVLLGAGYDTRPARLCARLRESLVFEVDHPDTARRKAGLADAVYAEAELAPTVPVAIEFARESIGQRLCAAGLDPGASTIWVWEGVSMYLTEQAVRDTLGLIARLSGPGSRAACDVLSDPRRAGLLGSAQRQVLDVTMAWVYSEPFLWHCRQDRIAEFFASCGLTVLEDLGLDELVSRYAKRDAGWLEAAPSLRLVVSASGKGAGSNF
jgi:methyltransferase (TIGR00027 family)